MTNILQIKEFNITIVNIHHLQELIDAVEAAIKK